MKKAGIVIAGCGNVAQALIALCEEKQRVCHKFKEGMTIHSTENLVAVHFGSGRELLPLIEWCQSNEVSLIQGSTGQVLPDEVPIPIVDAPNLSLPIIKLLGQILPVLKIAFGDMDITITESHQASKTSVPGTAKTMAKTFEVDEKNIVSIRQKEVQRLLGIPEKNLDGHGYHWINFQGQGVDISVSTKVNGRRTYAEGTLTIADTLIRTPIKLNQVYDITDFMGLFMS